MRLTKIYTRKGDKGFTHLANHRLSKDDLLVEVVGTLDELNSAIGIIIAFKIANKEIETFLTRVQNELFDMGGEFHLPQYKAISDQAVIRLEQAIDSWNQNLPPLEEFLLPRGNPQSATCHLARTICRRAERCIVRLHRQKPLSNLEIIRYLNRLSDALFVAARVLAKETEEKEFLWNHEKQKAP